MTDIRSAMIFAAGFGARMGALTADTPKPLVPLAGRPMIDYTIDLLRNAGITRIVANAHYLSDQMATHLESQNIIVSLEVDRILDTGGGLRAALPLLDGDPVITINPDVLWAGINPIQCLLSAWNDRMRALLMLVPKKRAFGTSNTGDFSLENSVIHRNGSYLYGGAQIIRTGDLGHFEADVFSLNVYWDHLAKSDDLNGAVYPDAWCDIGSPEGLATAEAMIVDV